MSFATIVERVAVLAFGKRLEHPVAIEVMAYRILLFRRESGGGKLFDPQVVRGSLSGNSNDLSGDVAFNDVLRDVGPYFYQEIIALRHIAVGGLFLETTLHFFCGADIYGAADCADRLVVAEDGSVGASFPSSVAVFVHVANVGRCARLALANAVMQIEVILHADRMYGSLFDDRLRSVFFNDRDGEAVRYVFL